MGFAQARPRADTDSNAKSSAIPRAALSSTAALAIFCLSYPLRLCKERYLKETNTLPDWRGKALIYKLRSQCFFEAGNCADAAPAPPTFGY